MNYSGSFNNLVNIIQNNKKDKEKSKQESTDEKIEKTRVGYLSRKIINIVK